jgi:hypothetical protein
LLVLVAAEVAILQAEVAAEQVDYYQYPVSLFHLVQVILSLLVQVVQELTIMLHEVLMEVILVLVL